MISFIRKFSNSLVAKVFLSIVAGSFILFWGINDVIRRFTNSDYIVKVGDYSVTPEEFQEQYQKNALLFQSIAQRLDKAHFQTFLLQYTVSSIVNTQLLDIVFDYYQLVMNKDMIKYILSHDIRFLGTDGKFSRVKFNEFLKENKFSEDVFVENIPNEFKIVLTKLLLATAYNVPSDLANFIKSAEEEQRFVNIYEVNSANVKDFPIPDDKVLMNFYEEKKETLFVIPEYRVIDVVEFDEKDIHSFVDEPDIKTLYQKRKKEEGIDEKYEEVRENLKSELEQEKNYAILADVTKNFEERVNSGKAFSEILKKHKFLKYKRVELTKNNLDNQNHVVLKEPIADHILVVAFDMTKQDEAVFVEAGGGTWFLVKVLDVKDSHIKKYEDVDKSLIYKEWNNAKKLVAVEKMAKGIVENINSGQTVHKSFKELPPLIRQDVESMPKELNKQLFISIFDLEVGKACFAKKGDNYVVAVLNKKKIPDTGLDIKEYSDALKATIVDDLFISLINFFKNNNLVKINKKMLNNKQNQQEVELESEDDMTADAEGALQEENI